MQYLQEDKLLLVELKSAQEACASPCNCRQPQGEVLLFGWCQLQLGIQALEVSLFGPNGPCNIRIAAWRHKLNSRIVYGSPGNECFQSRTQDAVAAKLFHNPDKLVNLANLKCA